MNTMSDMDKDFIIRIGRTITKLREINNFSQEDLSDFSKTHRTYLSEVEGGKRNPTVSVLKKIVGAFEMNMSSFFLMVEEEKKDE